MLQRIPAENRGPVAIVDFEGARNSGNGATLGTAEFGELRDILPPVARQAGLDFVASFLGLANQYTNLNYLLGAPPRDIERVAFFSDSLAVQDEFDLNEIEGKLRQHPEISGLTTGSHLDVEVFSWNEPALAAASAYDGYLYWAWNTAQLEGPLDTAAGEAESLAGVEEYARLAQALDRPGVYVASFNERLGLVQDLAANIARWELDAGRAEWEELEHGQSLGHEVQEQEEVLRMGPLLSPFGYMASGYGEDDEGPFIIAAALHESEEAAEENAPLVRERFESTETATGGSWGSIVDSYELDVDGRLLTGTFRLSDSDDSATFSMLPLFAFEKPG